MAFTERLGATGDSLRIRNNEWYIARSFNGQTDIKVFKVNEADEIEFFSTPSVQGDSFVLESQFQALEERVAILEEIIGSITAGNINIVPFTLTNLEITSKSVTLPQTPLPGKALLIPASGIPQLVDVDFTITGNVLSWNGFSLENQLAVNDAIKIIYMF